LMVMDRAQEAMAHVLAGIVRDRVGMAHAQVVWADPDPVADRRDDREAPVGVRVAALRPARPVDLGNHSNNESSSPCE